MADDASSSSPSDHMRDRVSGGALKIWFLMDADRRLVAALLTGVVFVALVTLGVLNAIPLHVIAKSADPMETLFQGLTGAIITGVTLVVTLSQLVLSQELGPVGDQHQRMEGALDFRETAEGVIGVPVAPPEPAAFLRALVAASEEHADTLQAQVTGGTEAAEKARSYAESLARNARQVQGAIEGTQFGTFDVLSAALDYNYSWKIYEGRKLQKMYGDDLPDDALATLDQLLSVLYVFGPAREHFKTLYFEWALINLSRGMMYTSIPALIVSMSSILYLGDATGPVTYTLGVDDMTWIVSGAVAVALVPFTLLLSYMLRITTVAKRTLAIGPFVLRNTDRTADLD